MSNCAPGWETSLFAKAAKKRSTFRGENSSDVPTRFRPGKTGRANFIAWAKMPEITYSASPDSLYNMTRLRQMLDNSDCFAKAEVEKQVTAGVIYPKTFYLGLVLGGSAILYTLFNKR